MEARSRNWQDAALLHVEKRHVRGQAGIMSVCFRAAEHHTYCRTARSEEAGTAEWAAGSEAHCEGVQL
eukprot:29487-Eustigmatos_ZCMA.PRE.1